MRISVLTPVCLAAVVALFSGCGEQAEEASSASGPRRPAWLLASDPGGARPVGEVKQTAAEGDAVVVRGRIGGRRDPITEGSAAFVIVDSSVPTCADIPGDNCPTPWDYCCEPRESLLANNATVRVVDESGETVAVNLGDYGFEPMDEVIVVGEVGSRPVPEALTITATRLHLVGG